jgi:ABC-type glutathione transport system ATPase component
MIVMMIHNNNRYRKLHIYYYNFVVFLQNIHYWRLFLLLICYSNLFDTSVDRKCQAFQASSYGDLNQRIPTAYATRSKEKQQQIQTRISRVSSILILPSRSFSSSSLYQQSSQQQTQQQLPTALLPPVISVDKITCSYDGGKTYQLQDTSYILQRTSKVALVGRNGAGKSTLLHIIAKAVGAVSSSSSLSSLDNLNDDSKFDISYTGSVTCARDVRISFVEQEPPMPSDVSVADALLGITTTTNTNSVSSTVTRQTKPRSVYDAVRRYRIAAQNAEDDRK